MNLNSLNGKVFIHMKLIHFPWEIVPFSVYKLEIHSNIMKSTEGIMLSEKAWNW